MPAFEAQAVMDHVAQIFRAAGTPPDIARRMAHSLVTSDLSGHSSHGVIRVADYMRFVRLGIVQPAARPIVAQKSACSVVVDGRSGFGHLGAEALTDAVTRMARHNGLAAGGLTRAAHVGRLGEWAELATEKGVLFFMCAGWASGHSAAPFGGSKARLGTNPLTFGAPALAGDRVVLDIATTAVAEGKVRPYRDEGTPVPSGWILDRNGSATTDPRALYDGGALLPFGGHKGYGLSVMVAILGSALVGAAAGGEDEGIFALAIDPQLFGATRSSMEAVGKLIADLRATPPAVGFSEVLVPGDAEERARSAYGGRVQIADATWRLVRKTGEDLGVAAPQFGCS
jgi:hydroxycarboxylate dehydrogenase B